MPRARKITALVLTAIVYASTNARSTENSSAGQAAAEIYVGVLQDLSLQSSGNVVEKLARGLGWASVPAEEAALGNAKISYYGDWGGHKVLIGSDGTNEIFSIAMRKDFSPIEFMKRLRQSVEAEAVGAEDSLGQRSEMYRLRDHGRELGLLLVTFGTAQAVKGTGSVGFVSSARAAREGIGQGHPTRGEEPESEQRPGGRPTNR